MSLRVAVRTFSLIQTSYFTSQLKTHQHTLRRWDEGTGSVLLICGFRDTFLFSFFLSVHPETFGAIFLHLLSEIKLSHKQDGETQFFTFLHSGGSSICGLQLIPPPTPTKQEPAALTQQPSCGRHSIQHPPQHHGGRLTLQRSEQAALSIRSFWTLTRRTHDKLVSCWQTGSRSWISRLTLRPCFLCDSDQTHPSPIQQLRIFWCHV